MRERCPHSPSRGAGWLVGWRLTFGGEDLGWEGALASVVEDAGDQVFVMVYDVPEQDEAALDAWEGADSGLYRKIRVRVQTLAGDELCWLYILDGYEGGVPSARYLGSLPTRRGRPEHRVATSPLCARGRGARVVRDPPGIAESMGGGPVGPR